jgi:hypothetical protein
LARTPAVNPTTAIETSAHRSTRSNDIYRFHAHGPFRRAFRTRMRPPRLREINGANGIAALCKQE